MLPEKKVLFSITEPGSSAVYRHMKSCFKKKYIRSVSIFRIRRGSAEPEQDLISYMPTAGRNR